MIGPINVKRKGGASVGYWANYVTLTFDLTHDIELVVSRSNFEIALFEEWVGWLRWNERDVSWSFMTMTDVWVTLVGWVDVPYSDWGDFRPQRAVEISRIDILSISCDTLSPSVEGYNTSLIISEHWFRYWLGAIKKWAITWASVDPDLCCHLASLGLAIMS